MKHQPNKPEKISQILKEKDLEIQRLKQQLNDYKGVEGRKKSEDRTKKIKKVRKENHIPYQRSSKSPDLLQRKENLSFKPKINTKSK